MPGTKIKVNWPVGSIIVRDTDPRWVDMGGANQIEIESADPNDHYRPWMEKNVGRQGWDWDWCLTDNDVAENRLTIKFRKGKEEHAVIAALKWV